ncbi:MAG: type I glyceraldehyde-3-phosphate dehydrogenase [bacterium]|nr:type I glyceraldehyde-3-phosphate dehydrogenase [bacterium]
MPTTIKLGINGLGRIGRLVLRNVWDDPAFKIVAVNSRSGAAHYAHLIKYDSSYGAWGKVVTAENNDAIIIDGRRLPLFHEADPARVPWGSLGVEVVVESTGVFRSRQDSAKHLQAGAQTVVISAPTKDADVTLVPGVNEDTYDPRRHRVISAASCTSNCLAPIVKVLHRHLRVVHGALVTTHAYTNDQSLVDAPHRKEDFRRARAAYESIIPTTTGAAETIGLVLPELAGKLSAISMRVPVMLPSALNLALEVGRSTSALEVNTLLQAACREELAGILSFSDLPLVSIDYKQNPHAGIVDGLSTEVVDGRLVSLLAWYDNEWGYVHQMLRLIQRLLRPLRPAMRSD